MNAKLQSHQRTPSWVHLIGRNTSNPNVATPKRTMSSAVTQGTTSPAAPAARPAVVAPPSAYATATLVLIASMKAEGKTDEKIATFRRLRAASDPGPPPTPARQLSAYDGATAILAAGMRARNETPEAVEAFLKARRG